ncbi:hypothetical protein [Polaromonas glacialis]|uniref:hypothetical protein n=1 Tax=Polaromonas glacialis TaxID=866564 RepID=UPI0006906733|nr:hypothetical protein [Polaromonas glacialis]
MPEQPNSPPREPAPAPLGRKRRGPKPKPHGEKRGASVTGRLTPAELAQLDAGRGALPRGEWLRTLALARRLPRAIPEINLEAYGALARAASNLNQLSRRANAADRLEIAELAATLATFRAALLGVGSELEEQAKADAQAQGNEGKDGDDGDQQTGLLP